MGKLLIAIKMYGSKDDPHSRSPVKIPIEKRQIIMRRLLKAFNRECEIFIDEADYANIGADVDFKWETLPDSEKQKIWFLDEMTPEQLDQVIARIQATDSTKP